MVDSKRIFDLALDTLIQNSNYPREKVLNRLDNFKNLNFELFDDRYLYQVLAYIPFYAGMKAKTVSGKIDIIKSYFSDYETEIGRAHV